MTTDIHGRLTLLVDENFGTRETMPAEQLLDILEAEVPKLVAQMDEELEIRAADIARDRADKIVSSIYACGNSLAPLLPETRLIVLRALCATFLTEEPKR